VGLPPIQLGVLAVKVVRTEELDIPGLGERIQTARKADGRSITCLAALADMSVQNWYRIEREQQALPLETLRLIEKALEVDFGVVD
jgi:ribosome-binding protein aMBF1 (putative translation factor)